MASARSLILSSSVLSVFIIVAGLMIIVSVAKLNKDLKQQRHIIDQVCLLKMSPERRQSDNLPCDFTLGASITSCIIIAGFTAIYYIYGLCKGGLEEEYFRSMLKVPFVILHPLMTVVHFIISVVVTFGISNFCDHVKTRYEGYKCSSFFFDFTELVIVGVGAWLAFLLWCILTGASFRRLKYN
ncbi:Uncharacterised protein g6890 [Pycnogonum litorale]